MGKKLRFCVMDTETTTFDWLHEIADDENKRKKIAIAKPLVYDMGWVICDRQGNIEKRATYLIAETFCTPAIFDNAYYADRKPAYLKAIENGETQVGSWNEVMKEFVKDLETVDFVGAYNTMFDQRAICYTDIYIKNLYSNHYDSWEKTQKRICEGLLRMEKQNAYDDYDNMNFHFRGQTYKNFDIWGMACKQLLNRQTYKKMCLDNEMITASGEYFSTSAEASYRYLCQQYDFEEAHTALADAEIEAFILSKCLKRKAVEQGIAYFPFRELGSTRDFLMTANGLKPEWFTLVINTICNKRDNLNEESNYYKMLNNRVDRLTAFYLEWDNAHRKTAKTQVMDW